VPAIGKDGTNFSVVPHDPRRAAPQPHRLHRHGAESLGHGQPGQLHVGTDAQFQLFDNVNIQSYYARTETPGRTGDQSSYRGRYDWNADRWGVQTEYLSVGEDFNPEVGFLRRSAFRRSFGQFRFSPRPKQPSRIRRCSTRPASTTRPGRAQARDPRGAGQLPARPGTAATSRTSR
jgi:hypothetical protein